MTQNIKKNNTPLQKQRPKIKVCGMKFADNILEISKLKPAYLGFIFYEKSKRNFEGVIPKLPKNIKKTGVFVNEYLEIVISLAEEYQLAAIQLHGDESVEYIKELKKHLTTVEIIKVFGIKNEFNFDVLTSYLPEVDFFLFDTKGKERGGNGIVFDWNVLKNYPFSTPYFLSGGIGLEQAQNLQHFLENPASKYCVAIDVNSKFEDEPGLKNSKKLKLFLSF